MTTPSTTTTSSGQENATVIVACPSCATRFRFRPQAYPQVALGSCSVCAAEFSLAEAMLPLYRVLDVPVPAAPERVIASVPIRPEAEPVAAEPIEASPQIELEIPEPDPVNLDLPAEAPIDEPVAPLPPSVAEIEQPFLAETVDEAIEPVAAEEPLAEIPTPEGGLVSAIPSLAESPLDAEEELPPAEPNPVEREQPRGGALRKVGALALPTLALAAGGYYATPMIPETARLSQWVPQGLTTLGSEANLTAVAGGTVGLLIGVALTLWLSKKS